MIAGALKESGTTRLVMLEYKDVAINLTPVTPGRISDDPHEYFDRPGDLACHVENTSRVVQQQGNHRRLPG